MKIIFLDIDGVMNCKNGYLKEGGSFGDGLTLHSDAVEALNHILDSVEDVRIVISSTYRWAYSVNQFKVMFEKAGIDYKYVISRTPDQAIAGHYRGDEIQDWLSLYPSIAKHKYGVDLEVENYVILDDDTDFLIGQRKNFVKCFKDYGLTFVEAQKAIDILNGVDKKKKEDIIIRRQVDAFGQYKQEKVSFSL